MNGYIDIPFQVIITGELRGEEYAAYRALTDKADEADVERIIEGVGKEKDDVLRGHYRVLLQLIIEKNPQFIETVRRDSETEDVLMEIVKDRVNEQVSAGKREQEQQTTVTHINDIMKNLKLTVEQAMDALSIPQSQRSTYAALVG